MYWLLHARGYVVANLQHWQPINRLGSINELEVVEMEWHRALVDLEDECIWLFFDEILVDFEWVKWGLRVRLAEEWLFLLDLKNFLSDHLECEFLILYILSPLTIKNNGVLDDWLADFWNTRAVSTHQSHTLRCTPIFNCVDDTLFCLVLHLVRPPIEIIIFDIGGESGFMV